MRARRELVLSSADALYGAVIRLARHRRRIRRVAGRLRAEVGVTPPAALPDAASGHDLGTLTVLRVTESERPLDAGDRALLILHLPIGEQPACAAGWPGAARVLRHRHERWDGGGYPDGLAGGAIPEPARLLTGAGRLVALAEARSYRRWNRMPRLTCASPPAPSSSPRVCPRFCASRGSVLEVRPP